MVLNFVGPGFDHGLRNVNLDSTYVRTHVHVVPSYFFFVFLFFFSIQKFFMLGVVPSSS